MIEHTSPISGIASFQNQYVSTAGYDNQVILWDARSKVALGRGSHDHLANQCRFSHDGSFLVSASSDHTARIWQVPSMKLMTVLTQHEDDVESVAISGDNELIATCSRDHRIRIFRRSGMFLRKLEGHTRDVISVEWIKSSYQLISSSDDGTVKRWDAMSGELLDDIDLGGAETDSVVITQEGIVFAANDDGDIVAIHEGNRYITEAHKAGIKRLVYSEQTCTLVSLSYDRSIKIWKVADKCHLSLLQTATIPAVIWPRSCCFIGPRCLAFGTFGSSYATLDLNTNQWDLDGINPALGVNAVLDFQGQVFTVGDAGLVKSNGQAVNKLNTLCNFLVAFEGHVITGGQTGEILDARTGRLIYQHRSPLNCGSSYQVDGVPRLAIGTYTGEVVILALNDREEVIHHDTVMIQHNAIKGLSNDGNVLFSVSATGQAAFHRLDDLAPVRVIPEGHDKISNGCAALGRGRFASVSRDLKLRIWNLSDSASCTASVIDSPHQVSIKCIAALPDKAVIATGSYNGVVALYDYRERLWIKSMRPTAAGVSSLCVKGDRSGFLAGSYDGKTYEILIDN